MTMWCMPKCDVVQLLDENGEPYQVPVKAQLCWSEGRTFAGGATMVAGTTYDILDTQAAVTNSTARDIEPLCAEEGFLVTGAARYFNRPTEDPTEFHANTGQVSIEYGSSEDPVEDYAAMCDKACLRCQIAGNGVTGALVAGEVLAEAGFPLENLACAFQRPWLVTNETENRGRLRYRWTPSVTTTLRTAITVLVTIFGYRIGNTCKPYYGRVPKGSDISCDDAHASPTTRLNRPFERDA
jgi:hypothetical protein